MTSKTLTKQDAAWTPGSSSVGEPDYFGHAIHGSPRTLEETTPRIPQGARESTSLQAWFPDIRVSKNRGLRHEEWIAERLRFAAIMLRDSVTIDAQTRGGVPVLKGTRVPVAQILAEIADDARLSEIADDLDLDAELITNLVEGMAIHLDRPFFK